MSVEEQLKEAMERHVSGMQASPGLGRAVRRGRRASTIRFRTAGALLAVAAVAGAVPAYQALTASPGTQARDVASAKVATEVAVPDVMNMTWEQAAGAIRAAGLVTDEPREGEDRVFEQRPAAGTMVTPGTEVELVFTAELPQDLGDLGDGRTIGGVRLTYLPDGLAWGKWSGKDGFGAGSYTTTYDTPDAPAGQYSIQIVVREGEALQHGESGLDKLPQKLDVNGRPGAVGNVGEGGEASEVGVDTFNEGSTPTLIFKITDEKAVELMMSPLRAKELGKDATVAELKKIAEGIEIAKTGQ
ncbi:PASTA domain-containing protein [Nonomuraea sp. NPDC050663]|uniref:PASTA domain-containing protein n=1 Tax=Nonomuraea sp. NPDC050663 TaxID=3364370 RepID=UPI003788C4CF